MAAVQRIDFPHRALLSNGTFGAVLPEFQAPLCSNPQGSLRKDLQLYDIILFIARGESKEVRCRCCERHKRRQTLTAAETSRCHLMHHRHSTSPCSEPKIVFAQPLAPSCHPQP